MNALAERNALRDIMRNSIPEDLGQFDVSAALDSINRGTIAGTLGAPADIGNEIMRPLGYGQEKPILGSEWIGDKMQQAGMVTERRNPIAEFVAGLADPLSTFTGVLKGAAALGKSMPAVAGIFAGKGAKLADMGKLAEAEQMLNAGSDPAQVWRSTGWGRGPDGRWRFEIPDNEAFPLMEIKGGGAIGADAKDAFLHDDLYKNYPESQDIYFSGQTKTGGSYSPEGSGTIRLGPDADNRLTPLHELQHAIQDREGFARGGTPGIYYPDERDIITKELYRYYREMSPQQPLPASDAYEIAKSYANSTEGGGHDIYKRLAGEAESRLTQARINLALGERADQYPWEPKYFEQATGVPIDKLIYRDN